MIHGVSPEVDFVPLIVPEIRGNEWKYIKECLDTNWVSSVGTYVDRFEQMIAERVGTKYAVATVNGTSALHIALIMAGVQADDEVLVSSLTFIAPVNVIRYVGAWPIFIDAELAYLQIDPVRVAEFLESSCKWDGECLRNIKTGRRVKAILPVHILGHPADLDPIIEIASKYSLPVIEDATEGLGAAYRGKSLGSLGDAACFSFNGNKIITTGGGGMLVTNNPEWAARAKYLTTQAKDDPIEYVHNAVGYNYRLTNLLAAMGCAQMEQLDAFVEAKRQIAKRYQESLGNLAGIRLPKEADWAFSTFWMYTVLVDEKESPINSRDLLRELATAGIQTRPLWQPIHRSKAHSSSHGTPCPNSDELYAKGISLPCSVGLTPSSQGRVIETLMNLMGNRNG
ncbi:LegC family aminotransferase [Telmatobacter sp. DSM 110680]|uniref:GDP-perosamine synthase n=1 Tax=Telmatobacter sp. DSM 110680 TaxID=3036704 RepID=A0AAU7DE67_9BACT